SARRRPNRPAIENPPPICSGGPAAAPRPKAMSRSRACGCGRRQASPPINPSGMPPRTCWQSSIAANDRDEGLFGLCRRLQECPPFNIGRPPYLRFLIVAVLVQKLRDIRCNLTERLAQSARALEHLQKVVRQRAVGSPVYHGICGFLIGSTSGDQSASVMLDRGRLQPDVARG